MGRQLNIDKFNVMISLEKTVSGVVSRIFCVFNTENVVLGAGSIKFHKNIVIPAKLL
jgi:hypothetical protein